LLRNPNKALCYVGSDTLGPMPLFEGNIAESTGRTQGEACSEFVTNLFRANFLRKFMT
jgi:hypothetical protein